MNRRGFTLVELITTFALTAVIVAILLNIVVIIKDIYVKYEVKTEMLIKQGEMDSYINDRITNGNLVSYTKVSDSEWKFTMYDNLEYTLKIDNTNKILSFGDFTYKLGKNASFGNITSPSSWVSGNNLQVKIEIKHSLYPNSDFGLNLVYVDQN